MTGIEGHVELTDIKEHVERILSGLQPRSKSEMDQWRWSEEIMPHLRATQLPERYCVRLKKWHPKQREVFDKCRDMLKSTGAIVCLVGPRGTGKTTIAAQLIIDRAMDAKLLPWHRRPPYRKAEQFLQTFKSLYVDYGSRNSEEMFRRFNNLVRLHPLIIIDEWHQIRDAQAADRMMTDFLDRRYSQLRDTLLISNQTVEQFMSETNDSTLSRMQECGGIIPCEWESFRD